MPTYQEERLTEIADAIRAKEGSTEPIVASTFAERIEALPTSGGTAGVRSFNGRTGAVVPGVSDYTAEMVGALSEDGGTLYGDLRIKGEGSTFGNKINFGDGENVQISEPEDDCLEIKAKKINFVTSDQTDQKFTLNGEPIGSGGTGEVSGGVTTFNNRTGDVIPQVGDYSPDMVGAVPTTRMINGKPLTTDITLDASDLNISSGVSSFNGRTGNVSPATGDYNADMVGAVPTTRTVNNKALSSNITITASDVSAVPTSRTINGKSLSSNITITASDLGISEGISISDVTNLLNRTTAVNVANTSYSTVMARGIYCGTTDLTAGSSSLTSGVIYLVYE